MRDITVIRYAADFEKEEIKRLFNISFPGEEGFADYFFKNLFKAENTLADVKNGVLRGSAMELPYNIKGIGEVTYLYAVATHPEFRGRGVCRGIINKSHENDRLKGRAASILIPGNKSLFEFYRKLGYKEAAFVSERKFFPVNKSGGMILGECSAEGLLKVYEKSLCGKNYIIRNKKYFERQLDMFKRFGGGCKGLYREERLVSYAFYSFEDEKIFFDEIMGDDKEILAGLILNELNLKEGLGREPGEGRALGMARFYGNSADFYMNLMFN